jgi:hypothetical protein
MGGKKGEMADFGSSHEKWKGTQYLRELPSSLAYAIKIVAMKQLYRKRN